MKFKIYIKSIDEYWTWDDITDKYHPHPFVFDSNNKEHMQEVKDNFLFQEHIIKIVNERDY